ncbi:hypothetical protein M2132_002154 [Dysgonomonas sp. PH5-45]|uniref:hypothetical protein n=1 Tax=unclassified Dysgonomonas TaxID=2630389 RepID=UPI002476F7AE|nr:MULTISPECIES: hypothetical protein [unclassified Dysgonomonas]MDH6355807.1 hypothetical protein [Dysgonomonas sp. PH5-45]MDH6388704.1 hypothetical protein [Dysgonomonas sp. PH5-37]
MMNFMTIVQNIKHICFRITNKILKELDLDWIIPGNKKVQYADEDSETESYEHSCCI